jgi:2-deoxy-D-gluconate 3-dehydrogenase
VNLSALDDFDLEGRVIVVTGAGRGIGRAIASDIAASGGTVIGCSRTAADLESLKEEIAIQGRKCEVIAADLSNKDGIETMIEFALAVSHRIDGLVNNAGVNIRHDAVDYNEAEFDEVINLNLRTVFWSCVLAAKQMITQNTGGGIVNITSQAGVVGAPGRAPYSAAKAGVSNLTRTLAAEWGKFGIRVNALAPTVTLTSGGKQAMVEWPDLAQEVREQVLLGRPAELREVSTPTVFLLSRAAGMITGHTLVVDGGWTAV